MCRSYISSPPYRLHGGSGTASPFTLHISSADVLNSTSQAMPAVLFFIFVVLLFLGFGIPLPRAICLYSLRFFFPSSAPLLGFLQTVCLCYVFKTLCRCFVRNASVELFVEVGQRCLRLASVCVFETAVRLQRIHRKLNTSVLGLCSVRQGMLLYPLIETNRCSQRLFVILQAFRDLSFRSTSNQFPDSLFTYV
jgi:hypothetical protein